MNKELEKRAVACKHWRWMPGMVWCLPSSAPGPMKGRMIGNDPSGLLLSVGWPDLTDPATLGCLLALVESLHGVAWLVPCPTIGWFCFYGKMGTPDKESTYAMSRAEALVAALEAAEGREVKDE